MSKRSGTRVSDAEAKAAGWERAALRLRAEDLAALDEVADHLGLSRSAAVASLARDRLAGLRARKNRQTQSK